MLAVVDDPLLDQLLGETTALEATGYRDKARGFTEIPSLAPQAPFAERLAALQRVAHANLTLARLVEGHADAVRILHEAGRRPAAGALYAVWASGGPEAQLTVVSGQSGMVLEGSKPFCSGADLVDRALVHTDSNDGARLVEVDMAAARRAGTTVFDNRWSSAAFAESHTWSVKFEGVPTTQDSFIGAPGWYFLRPGFWHGALAPAACWAGGARTLLTALQTRTKLDEHAAAHLGAIWAECYCMDTLLESAGQWVDSDPEDRAGLAYPRALAVRHRIEQGVMDVSARFGRVTGPRPLAFDPAMGRHVQELQLYVRQCHAERDLAELGRHVFPGSE